MKLRPSMRRPGRIASCALALFATLVFVLAGCASGGNSHSSSLSGIQSMAANAQGLLNTRHSLKQQTTTFPVQIDATQLMYANFVIPYPAPATGWLSTKSIQTLNLAPGTYNFQIASGWFADFTFIVTSTGTIDYNHSFDGFLSGRGTTKLVVVGLQVTLDARYLSGNGIIIVSANNGWMTYAKVRMVPGSYYQVQQGSGEAASFSFKLLLNGTFSYDPSYDIASGGFLAGNNTSTLQFLGYPILVDARAANGAGVTIVPIGMPFSYTSVEYADLLPAPSFALLVNSGIVTKAVFSLNDNGGFSFDSSLDPYLSWQKFNGLTLLKVLGPLPTQ